MKADPNSKGTRSRIGAGMKITVNDEEWSWINLALKRLIASMDMFQADKRVVIRLREVLEEKILNAIANEAIENNRKGVV